MLQGTLARAGIGLFILTRSIYPVNRVGGVMEEGALGRDWDHSPQRCSMSQPLRLPSLPHIPGADGVPRQEDNVDHSMEVAVPTQAPAVLLEQEPSEV